MHRFLCRRLFSIFLGIYLELKTVRFHFHFIWSAQKACLPPLSWEDSHSYLPLAKGGTWPYCGQSYEYDTQARPLWVLLLRLYSCSWRSSCNSDVSGLEEGGWDLWHWLPPHGKGLSALGKSRGYLSRDGLDLQREDSFASSSHPQGAGSAAVPSSLQVHEMPPPDTCAQTTASILSCVWLCLCHLQLLLKNLASVHQCRIETRRQSFGGVEGSRFITLPGKGGPQQANVLKTVPQFLGNRKGSYSFRVENKVADKDVGWGSLAFFFSPWNTEIIRSGVRWFEIRFWWCLRLLLHDLLSGMKNARKGKECYLGGLNIRCVVQL